MTATGGTAMSTDALGFMRHVFETRPHDPKAELADEATHLMGPSGDGPSRAALNTAPFRRGEVADAEPAAPGWRFAVDELSD